MNVMENFEYIEPTRPRSSMGKKLLLGLACLYPLFVLALTLVNALEPRRTGLLGLSAVFGPYLFLPLLLLVPLAFMRGAHILRLLLVVCAVAYGLRFPPSLLGGAPQGTPGALQLSVLHWNTLAGGSQSEILEVLKKKGAGIVGISEANWQWLQNDPEIAELYPYRRGVQARGPVSGQAVLSVYPVIEQGVVEPSSEVWGGVPRAVWARLDVGLGRTVVVVVAHPPPGRTCGRSTFPRGCYDTSIRDRQIELIAGFMRPYLEAGERLLLLGDFNVTEREPAYADLSSGLQDAHRVAGTGIGATWRPRQIISQPFALLRIDYIFSSLNITPLALQTDCTPGASDHCIVEGKFEVK